MLCSRSVFEQELSATTRDRAHMHSHADTGICSGKLSIPCVRHWSFGLPFKALCLKLCSKTDYLFSPARSRPNPSIFQGISQTCPPHHTRAHTHRQTHTPASLSGRSKTVPSEVWKATGLQSPSLQVINARKKGWFGAMERWGLIRHYAVLAIGLGWVMIVYICCYEADSGGGVQGGIVEKYNH